MRYVECKQESNSLCKYRVLPGSYMGAPADLVEEGYRKCIDHIKVQGGEHTTTLHKTPLSKGNDSMSR